MPDPTYKIELSNCNSISEASISIQRSALNIKYGPNGVGKSTIARALKLQAEGEEALSQLLPFKYRSKDNPPSPKIDGASHIASVLTFNEEYISQFAFQLDEVVKNSFEIFVNTEEYRKGIDAIQSLFAGLQSKFAELRELDAAISGFTELRNAFTLTKSGAIAKTSRGHKALAVGGKLDKIPDALSSYEEFLHSAEPADWVTWQSKGKSFLELSENCPFCGSRNVDKSTAIRVSEEYESSAVKNMSALREVVGRLDHYFAPEKYATLRELLSLLDEMSPEQSLFLVTLSREIDVFLGRLKFLQELSFSTLRDSSNIEESLRSLKIDLSFIPSLDSDATRSVVASLNGELDALIEKIGEVQKGVGIQRTRTQKLIKDNQGAINDFLESAGYRYRVRIKPSENAYRMILEHEDYAGHLDTAAQHLSYGERNAFALVLFMHHVRRDAPDLVVLDDPVSSFDKTKKFAVLHQLFHGPNSIRDHTTLLLTHDIEPAIDIVRVSTSDQFKAAKPRVHFLKSRRGIVEEKLVEKQDIHTFSRVCDENIQASDDDVIKCIYLRRKYEMHGALGSEYDVLSSLLHLRTHPDRPAPTGTPGRVELTAPEIDSAVLEIRKAIPHFDYDLILRDISNVDSLKRRFESTDVGYEKVQLLRILFELGPTNSKRDAAFTKMVNEPFHIENEYVMQLNPRKYDAVPDHVIDQCAEMLLEF